MFRVIIEAKRKIVKEQFQKLKDEFLTKEQSLKVHLEEKPNDFWLMERPWSNGFTELHWIEEWVKVDYVKVYICLIRGNERINSFLRTIAHEFAHAYLAFNNPAECGDNTLEHDKWTVFFFKFLVTNYHQK